MLVAPEPDTITATSDTIHGQQRLMSINGRFIAPAEASAKLPLRDVPFYGSLRIASCFVVKRGAAALVRTPVGGGSPACRIVASGGAFVRRADAFLPFIGRMSLRRGVCAFNPTRHEHAADAVSEPAETNLFALWLASNLSGCPYLRSDHAPTRRGYAMLYFFNVAGAEYDPAVEGLVLSSLGEARAMAARFAGELIRDRPGLVWAGEELRVQVTDADQQILFTVVVLGIDAPAAVASATTAAG